MLFAVNNNPVTTIDLTQRVKYLSLLNDLDANNTNINKYIDDLIGGLIKMMENNSRFWGPVNLGNPKEFTVKELAEKILELIPESKSNIIYRDLPSDDPKKRSQILV